jgi:hypothetical protein
VTEIKLWLERANDNVGYPTVNGAATSTIKPA